MHVDNMLTEFSWHFTSMCPPDKIITLIKPWLIAS